ILGRVSLSETVDVRVGRELLPAEGAMIVVPVGVLLVLPVGVPDEGDATQVVLLIGEPPVTVVNHLVRLTTLAAQPRGRVAARRLQQRVGPRATEGHRNSSRA